MSPPSSVTTDTLRKLHRLHERLRGLNERLDRGPRVSTAHANNLSRLEAQLAEAQAKAKELRIKTDEKQVLLKTGEANVERRRRQLREANDNREYQALLDQIAADQMANSVLEDEILESMEKLDRSGRLTPDTTAADTTASLVDARSRGWRWSPRRCRGRPGCGARGPPETRLDPVRPDRRRRAEPRPDTPRARRRLRAGLVR